MSQKSNRYLVLQNKSDELEFQSEPEPKIMSSSLSLEWSPRIYVRNTTTKLSTSLNLQLATMDTNSKVALSALLDSGATGMFLDSKFIQSQGWNTKTLTRPIPVYNVDGTLNQGGSIKEEIELLMTFQNHTERATFAICDLGDKLAIIGHNWLFLHNPEINWKTGEVSFSRCPDHCQLNIQEKATKKKARQMRRPSSVHLDSTEYSQENAPAIPDDASLELDLILCIPDPDLYINAAQNISSKLAEEATKANPQRSFEEIVPKAYHGFKEVFSKKAFDKLPPRGPWDHAIDLVPGAQPFRSKLYPLSPAEQVELDKMLKEHLESGRIRSSKSPMASPFFFIKKKNGGLRPIQDYRKLNEITIKNSYPLPLLADIISKLKKAKYFSLCDVMWGYNNIRIKEGDEWKAAFRINRGLFEPLVMFFGLTNSPATFQAMMNEIFKDLIEEGVVIVYMDDILIFTETLEEHQKVVQRVLEILKQNHLYLNPEKCLFEKIKISYLGLIISKGQVEMDPVKVEGVKNWPVPKTVKEIQSFLGFINFYRRFIEGFASIAKPLHDLTRKDTPWNWSESCQEAFDSLKMRVTSSPILVFPDDSNPYRVEADSSDYATGAVLSQLCADEKWHPVAYLSKALSPVERNYEIHDKEMLAIIRALEEWRHFLEGAKHQVEIWTDHKNLEYFMTAKKLNRRQARWSLFLSQFDFKLHHRPGSRSMKPDALSRRADHGKGENDNNNVILLKPEKLHIQALRQGHILLEGSEKTLLQKIRKSKDLDERVVKAVSMLRQAGVKDVIGEDWSEEQGLILFRGKVYVPKDKEIRRQIVKLHHDSTLTGHPGRWKTLELVSRNYWWPNISRYVASYVKSCDRCNRTKTFPNKPVGKLTPNAIPSAPWDVLTVDLITGLPLSQGYNAIIVMVDRFTKMVHVAPCHDTVTSEGVARLFRDNIWKHHGLPLQVISDRGPQFVSGFMRELNKLLGIKITPSTAYHPQTDGQTERVNQEIEQYLRLFVNHRQDDWAEWLPLAEFSYNNRVQSSTRYTPFILNSGRHPRLGTEPIRETKVEAVATFLNKMSNARKEAAAALQQASDDMKRFYDHSRSSNITFNIGDMVWLDGKDLRTDRPSKKLEDKRYGPFKIKRVLSPQVYELHLPSSIRIHPVFNVVKLRPFTPDPILGRHNPSPSPLIVDGELTEYEVETILDSRLTRSKLFYKVKWKGYPLEESTWEPTENLGNSSKLVKQFHERHPSAPRKIGNLEFQALPFQKIINFTEFHTKKQIHDWTQGRHIEDNVILKGG